MRLYLKRAASNKRMGSGNREKGLAAAAGLFFR